MHGPLPHLPTSIITYIPFQSANHSVSTACWLTNIQQHLTIRPASWSSGQGLCLLIMRSRGKIPMVTMVWVVSRFRLKAPPGISSSCISPLTSSGQCSRASWLSQPQKSATLSPQPGGKPRKFVRTCGGIGGGKLK